jgi:hypothetical protein
VRSICDCKDTGQEFEASSDSEAVDDAQATVAAIESDLESEVGEGGEESEGVPEYTELVDADPNEEFPGRRDESRRNKSEIGFIADEDLDVPDWVITGDPMGPEGAEEALQLGPQDGGVDVDIGPTDPEIVQRELGVYFDNVDGKTHHTSSIDAEGLMLAREEVDQIERALTERHGEDAVNTAKGLIYEQKKSGGAGEAIQTEELVAKRALGIEGPVRKPPGTDQNTIDYDEIDPETVAAFRDFSRISRSVMKHHNEYFNYGDDGMIEMSRGLSGEKSAELLGKQFERPEADTHRFNLSALANHSARSEVSEIWASPLEVHHQVSEADIGMAPNVLEVGLMKDEVRLYGRTYEATPEEVNLARGRGRDDIEGTMEDVTDTLSNPSAFDREDHELVLTAARKYKDVATSRDSVTSEAVSTIESWANACDEHGLLPGSRQKLADGIVDVLRGKVSDD